MKIMGLGSGDNGIYSTVWIGGHLTLVNRVQLYAGATKTKDGLAHEPSDADAGGTDPSSTYATCEDTMDGFLVARRAVSALDAMERLGR